jgi:hypothetical protein
MSDNARQVSGQGLSDKGYVLMFDGENVQLLEHVAPEEPTPGQVSHDLNFDSGHTGVSDEEDDDASSVSSEEIDFHAFKVPARVQAREISEDDTSDGEEDVLGLDVFDDKDEEWTDNYVTKGHLKRRRDSVVKPSPKLPKVSREQTQPTDDDEVVDLKPNKCTWPGCSMAFHRPHRLRDHMQRHQGIKEVICEEDGCGRAFATKADRRHHIRRVHLKTYVGCRRKRVKNSRHNGMKSTIRDPNDMRCLAPSKT